MSIPTHVYMLETSDGVLKIGMTGNPSRRLGTLRGDARKRGARVTRVAFWESNDPWKVEEFLLVAARMECVAAWGHEYFYGSLESGARILARLTQFIRVDVTSERIDHRPHTEAEEHALLAAVSQRMFAGLIA